MKAAVDRSAFCELKWLFLRIESGGFDERHVVCFWLNKKEAEGHLLDSFIRHFLLGLQTVDDILLDIRHLDNK